MTLLVFSDDWGRHPTSCQHLIRQLLPKIPVIWVNMIGMRRPKLEWYTAFRGMEKLKQWIGPGQPSTPLPDNLRVVSPVVWPGFAHRLERGINIRLMLKQLNRTCEELSEPPIAITTMPTVADLVGKLPVRRWIYYCVDDFTTWPGLDHAAVERMENRLIDQADGIIAVSENLQHKIARRGRIAELLTHGVDVEMWAKPLPDKCSLDAAKPWITYWGLIDRRMDLNIIKCLSNANLGTVLLVGPTDHPHPELMDLPRTVMPGKLPIEQLPGLAAESSVLILPYADLPVTQAIQPLKLKEYLATGQPVVARKLPAILEWADSLDLAEQPSQFVQSVDDRLRNGLPSSQKLARQRLARETWTAKAVDFYRIVANL